MIRFFVVFVLLLLLLFTLEITHLAQNLVVLPWTALLAKISAVLLSAFDSNVIAYGKILQDGRTGHGVSIEAGCNGIEACIILVAAMVAYPARWGHRLAGIAVGMIAIQAVNILRIISLFYLAAWNHAAFEFAHLYLWQALIMLDVIVVWLLWIRWVSRREVDHGVVA